MDKEEYSIFMVIASKTSDNNKVVLFNVFIETTIQSTTKCFHSLTKPVSTSGQGFVKNFFWISHLYLPCCSALSLIASHSRPRLASWFCSSSFSCVTRYRFRDSCVCASSATFSCTQTQLTIQQILAVYKE